MKMMFASRFWSSEMLSVFCAIGLASGFSGCSPGVEAPAPAPAGLAADPSAINGEIITYVADFEDGHSERWYALRQTDGHEVRLEFDAPPSVTAGRRVWVRGQAINDSTLRVTDMELATSPQVERVGALTADDPDLVAAPAVDSYALVLVDLGAGVNLTAAQAQARLTSTIAADRSFASYYNESSYGKYSVTGTVVGPFPYAMTTCATSAMATAVEAMFPAASYNHVIFYFNRSALCAFGGLGEEGTTVRPSRRTWMNGSLTCVVLMQEPGHNLGLMHANTMTCPGASFSTTPATSCTITEYGSQLTTMGSGCRGLNAYERWYMQWMAGCNGVRVPAGGTFNLLPLENSCPGGVQVLQIPLPAPRTVSDPQSTNTVVTLRNYYVELRVQAGGFDTYTAGTPRAGATAFAGPTVFVYVSDDVRPPATTGRGQTSVWTELLNMNPTGTAFAGLTTPGQSFVDPAGAAAGPTITLQAISATGATVVVTNPVGTGAPTCSDGTMLAGSGPPSCGAVTGLGGAPGADGGAGLGGATGTAGATGAGGARGAGGATGTAGAAGTAGTAGARGSDAGTGTGGGTTAGGGVIGPGGASGTPDGGSNQVEAITGGCGCSVPAGTAPLWTGIAGAAALALARKRRRPGRQ